MAFRSTNRLIVLVALAASLSAAAQTPQTSSTPAENDVYRSAFEGYRPFAAGDVQDWRRANDTVREIGGWRAYAREIQAGSAQASDLGGPRPSQPKAGDPHAGHRK